MKEYPMPIAMADLGPFHLARLTGDLTIDLALELQTSLDSHLAHDAKREFVLDLSRVGAVDPAGIGAIISTAAKARGKGHRIYLYSPAPHIQKIMEQLEITDFFPMIENEADLLSRLPD